MDANEAPDGVGAAVSGNPPRENLVRAVFPGSELRTAEDGTRTLHGHFSVFNEWTEIDSMWEGRFMERIAPGAFNKTIAENRNRIKVLFDHGHDPSIGNKPLGPIRSLEEDERGARYEVDLLDTSYNRDLIPALEKGLLGASFRFSVTRDEKDNEPERSAYNPEGIPERTIKEVKLHEFGPVTFPAYEGATAGVRSLTDDWILRHLFAEPERLERVLEMRSKRETPTVTEEETETAPSETAPAAATQSDERRETKPNKRFKNSEDWQEWLLTNS